MIQQWKTIEEFEAAPEEGIYFVCTKIRDIEIPCYFNDKFYSDLNGRWGSWGITPVMKITLPDPPNNA